MSIPIVPYHAFFSLAGEELAEHLEQLVASRNCSEIVLYSDVQGGKLALLPVGDTHKHSNLSELAGREIDGLHPLCALRPPRDGTAPDPLRERELDLIRLEHSLKARETYLSECEHRIADVGHNLSVREALLEQREHILIGLEKDYFDRTGISPTDVQQPGGKSPA
jgi:hypothetical protein